MLYISVEDFLTKASSVQKLTRQEEIACALAMKQGDSAARERLICAYLPQVAGHISHCKDNIRTLSLVYGCLAALEKAVDSFDFTQDSEPFSHRLGWWLRQATTERIVRR